MQRPFVLEAFPILADSSVGLLLPLPLLSQARHRYRRHHLLDALSPKERHRRQALPSQSSETAGRKPDQAQSRGHRSGRALLISRRARCVSAPTRPSCEPETRSAPGELIVHWGQQCRHAGSLFRVFVSSTAHLDRWRWCDGGERNRTFAPSLAPGGRVERTFPSIHERCVTRGYDVRRWLERVCAHFFCRRPVPARTATRRAKFVTPPDSALAAHVYAVRPIRRQGSRRVHTTTSTLETQAFRRAADVAHHEGKLWRRTHVQQHRRNRHVGAICRSRQRSVPCSQSWCRCGDHRSVLPGQCHLSRSRQKAS
jgi:hypothetical protein